MKYTGKGKLRDSSNLDVPVYQNGKIFKHGKQQMRAGFIRGKKSIYSCNTLRIDIIEDLALIVKEFGTVELRSSVYDNVPYSIWVKKKPGMRHRFNVFLRNLRKRNVIIEGRIESLVNMTKTNVAVEIKLTKWGTEISTKYV